MAGSLIANSSFSSLVNLLAKYASHRSIFDDACSLDAILQKEFFSKFFAFGCLPSIFYFPIFKK